MTAALPHALSRRGPCASSLLLALALAGCAGGEGPQPSSVAVELATSSMAQLRGARRVWIAGAVSRTGELATGMTRQAEPAPPGAATAAPPSAAASAAPPSNTSAAAESSQGAAADGEDVREDLARAVGRVSGLELAPARDAADLVLYYEQADRLRCFGCRQPEDLWYWWGVVADPAGHELASLHGETEGGADAAARQFVKAVEDLVQRRPQRSSGEKR
jgi:hypothetical protein